MKTLLIVNSSPRPDSVSRRLTRHYAEQWQALNPDGRMIERDVASDPPPFVTHSWIEAAYTPVEQRSQEQSANLALSDKLIEEVAAADEIVLGVPMHNFSIPATLKAWIDMITRAGRTFRYGANGAQGLIPSKKVVAVVSQGGSYGQGSAADFQVPYLRHMLAFIGLTDVEVVRADRQGMGPEAAEQSVARARAELSVARDGYAEARN
jgi:FMN-dependent NADH-azoreductase